MRIASGRRASGAWGAPVRSGSPRFGAAFRAWAEPRVGTDGALARMGRHRAELLSPGGWRRLHEGGPPFTLSDYRVFVTACLAGLPGPAAETALGAFRRALEGTLASAGAAARRLEPDALLSLAAELVAPGITGRHDGGAERPVRRWSPRDPLHEQCIAPGCALGVTPRGLAFHEGGLSGPGGNEDVAVRVLSALAFPEVWPGWRGNALLGDFHRDFLQPGCPVLTCLTVATGDEAAGEKAFLKSARATQQAGTGIARYLPGLPEKARDWQTVTERLKDGERLVRASYMAAVYAPLDGLDEAEQAVRAIYHGQGWRVGAERYMQLPSWLAWSAGVRDRARDAGAPRPGETEGKARGERAETRTDTIVKGAARGAREEVTKDGALSVGAGISTRSSIPMPCSPTWSRARTASGARWRTRASTKSRS